MIDSANESLAVNVSNLDNKSSTPSQLGMTGQLIHYTLRYSFD